MQRSAARRARRLCEAPQARFRESKAAATLAEGDTTHCNRGAHTLQPHSAQRTTEKRAHSDAARARSGPQWDASSVQHSVVLPRQLMGCTVDDWDGCSTHRCALRFTTVLASQTQSECTAAHARSSHLPGTSRLSSLLLPVTLLDPASPSMSRARDGDRSVKPSWTRKYVAGSVAMGSSTRVAEANAVPPLLEPEQLWPNHSKPFELRSMPPREGLPVPPPMTTAGKQMMQASASASSLPRITSPTHDSGSDGFLSDEAKQRALHASLSSPHLFQNLRDEAAARHSSATRLVQSFHSHHSSYQYLVQKLTRDLEVVLESTKAPPSSHQDPSAKFQLDNTLKLERTEGVMRIMRQLAASSPNSSTFTALVDELSVAIYNAADTCGIEFREFDPEAKMTFWDLSRTMDEKSAQIFAELEHVQARANYCTLPTHTHNTAAQFQRRRMAACRCTCFVAHPLFLLRCVHCCSAPLLLSASFHPSPLRPTDEFHESGERNVMLSAIDKWQGWLVTQAFITWRDNCRRVRAQRRAFERNLVAFEARQRIHRQRKLFALWKNERVRTQREVVGPQVIQLSAESSRVTAEAAATNKWINEATNALKDLGEKLAEFNAEKSRLTQDLERLQTDLTSFKALKLQDVANFTLEVARELLLSLQDELEYHMDPKGPYQRDGYAMLTRMLSAPKLAEKDIKPEKEKTGTKKKKKKKAGAGAEKEEKKKEEEAEKKEDPSAAADPTSPTAASAPSPAGSPPLPEGTPTSPSNAGATSTTPGASPPAGGSPPVPDESMLTAAQLEAIALSNALALEDAAADDDFDPLSLEARYASMSDTEILILWFNYQLRMYHWRAAPSYDEFQPSLQKRIKTAPVQIGNLSSDLTQTPRISSAALLMLLESIAPILNYQQSFGYLLHHEFDRDLRLKSLVNIVGEFNPDCVDLVSLEGLLLNKAPDLTAAMVAKLFVYYPNIPSRKSGMAPVLARLEAMKLERRSIFSRLTKISLKHAEFDAIYIQERHSIEVSRIQASRFLRTMSRQDLLKVHLTSSWNEHAQEEAARLAKIQAEKDEAERIEREKAEAIVAAEKAAHEAAIARAKETLGFQKRSSLEAAGARALNPDGTPATPATATASGGSSSPASPPPVVINPLSSDGKKKTRKQMALEYERARLAQEEEAHKLAAAAAASAVAAPVETAPVEEELDPFSPEEAQIYVEYIRKFSVEFTELYALARKHMDRVRRGEQMYGILQRRMNGFITDVLVRRVNLDPLPIIDPKAQRDFVSFTTLQLSRLGELMQPGLSSDAQAAEILLCQGELANDYAELVAIFRAYSRVDRAAGVLDKNTEWSGCLMMTSRDFHAFMTDLKVASRSVKQAQIDDVYAACCDGRVISRVALSPPQFVEALVRLAALRYPMQSLGDSLALFLKQDVLKRGRKIVSGGGTQHAWREKRRGSG